VNGFARLYGPMALLFVMSSFLPFYATVTVHEEYGTRTATYGSLWDMPGDVAVAAGMVLAALVILLLVATFRRVGAGVPTSIAVLAAAIVVLVLSKPGTGDPTPPMTDTGKAGIALACCTFVLAAVHALAVKLATGWPEETSAEPAE
jgi:hypothetical protein